MFISYQNGNYRVMLNDHDGTKIRYNDEDYFAPDRPESIDVKISNACEHGCVFCHEDSHVDGRVASLPAMKHFCDSLPLYTECAVGGGNLMLAPVHTEVFLKMLREVDAIPSITVRQDDFIRYREIIKRWRDDRLVYGIGVSLTDSKDPELYRTLSWFPTAVVHVIAGLFTEDDYWNMVDYPETNILILGYKNIRRGKDYFEQQAPHITKNIKELEEILDNNSEFYGTMCFDNLAIEQLHVKDHVPAEIWENNYMGDDGQFTFYVDLVKEEYAKSSTSLGRYPIEEDTTIIDMFNKIREEKND